MVPNPTSPPDTPKPTKRATPSHAPSGPMSSVPTRPSETPSAPARVNGATTAEAAPGATNPSTRRLILMPASPSKKASADESTSAQLDVCAMGFARRRIKTMQTENDALLRALSGSEQKCNNLTKELEQVRKSLADEVKYSRSWIESFENERKRSKRWKEQHDELKRQNEDAARSQ